MKRTRVHVVYTGRYVPVVRTYRAYDVPLVRVHARADTRAFSLSQCGWKVLTAAGNSAS